MASKKKVDDSPRQYVLNVNPEGDGAVFSNYDEYEGMCGVNVDDIIETVQGYSDRKIRSISITVNLK